MVGTGNVHVSIVVLVEVEKFSQVYKKPMDGDVFRFKWVIVIWAISVSICVIEHPAVWKCRSISIS